MEIAGGFFRPFPEAAGPRTAARRLKVHKDPPDARSPAVVSRRNGLPRREVKAPPETTEQVELPQDSKAAPAARRSCRLKSAIRLKVLRAESSFTCSPGATGNVKMTAFRPSSVRSARIVPPW